MRNLLTRLSVGALLLAQPCLNHVCAEPRAANIEENLEQQGLILEPDSLLAESREGLWLVGAKCLSLIPEQVAIWQVQSVFNGPPSLKNTTFKASHKQQFHGMSPRFTPGINEESLWVVQVHKEGGLVMLSPSLIWFGTTTRPAYGELFPVAEKHLREEGSFSSYAQVKEYARSIEQVAKAERQEQIRLLTLHTRSSVPSLSAWAISTLAESDWDGAPQLLLDLMKTPQLSNAAMLVLEQELQVLDDKGKVAWAGSPERFALWHRVVTSPAGELDAYESINLLINLSDAQKRKRAIAEAESREPRSSIDGSQFFEWSRLAADNVEWTPRVRGFAVAAVGHIAKNKQIEREAAWRYLLPLIQSHPDFAAVVAPDPVSVLQEQLAEGAVAGIRQLKPFSRDESATLQALRIRAKSSRWKGVLTYALRPDR